MDQSTYQVRFDWGSAGFRRLASADIVVLVDVLEVQADADAAALRALAEESSALVCEGSLRNASAVAEAILQEQVRRDRRTSVSLIAVGDSDDAGPRFALEDSLAAGAIIEALIARGIDHTSPEAMVAAEAFRGLRGALRHLISASGSARALRAASTNSVAAEAMIAAARDHDAEQHVRWSIHRAR